MTVLRRVILLWGIFFGLVACNHAGDVQDVFALLDLDRLGLEEVKAHCDNGQWGKASEALLEYYRTRQGVYIPGSESREASDRDSLWADDALRHTFHVLEDTVWNYGKDINWEYWPVKDIEMRVQLWRSSATGSLTTPIGPSA